MIAPESTQAVLTALALTGELAGQTITYVDDATGNVVSGTWNDFSPETQQNIRRFGFVIDAGLTVAGGAGIAAKLTKLSGVAKLEIVPKAALDVPGRVQSRINLANGSTRFTPLNDVGNPVASGWEHVVSRHFGGTNTQSQFTLSQSDVRGILQSDKVVSTPVSEVKMINGGPTYVRTVDVGQPIGTIRQSQGGGITSKIMIQTDRAGNLITAYPVP